MQTVTLTPKRSPTISIEAENITPDAFAGKSTAEIGAITAWSMDPVTLRRQRL